MILQILLLLTGFVILVKGADWLVYGASSLARKYKVADLTIGLTIVAFGTSAPELVVNTIASYQNHADIVLGNVIGSNIFNLFIILGISGLITPLIVHSNTVWREIPFSLAAVIVLFFLANDTFYGGENILTRFDGIVLLVMFAGFLYYIYRQLKTDRLATEVHQETASAKKIWFLIIIGLACLILGGKLVVDNAILLARTFGISEKIIGLTIIAAGTSLPELATSVVAAVKKNNDIAVGNIIGSNIFNIFLILGVSSVIHPVTYKNTFNTDIYLLTGGTLLLFAAMFTGKKKKLDRWEAFLLLIVYVIYTVFLITQR